LCKVTFINEDNILYLIVPINRSLILIRGIDRVCPEAKKIELLMKLRYISTKWLPFGGIKDFGRI
jgi:hypothetical protein